MARSKSGSVEGDPPSDEVPSGYRRLNRTLSSASSKFSFMPNRKDKDAPAKEYRVAVYDALEGKLWADTEENIAKDKFVKVPIRGQDTKVAVYIEVGPKEKRAKIYIATVDLERLGKWVKPQRKKKKMQHLYVLGQIPHGLGPLNEETEES